MRVLVRVLALVLASAVMVAVAADETQEQRALAGAQQLAKALKELDAETVVKLSLPDLRWATGGDAKMLEIMSQKFAEGKKAGMVVDSVTLGQRTRTGDDGSTRYIFFPYTSVAHTKGFRIIDRAFLLALSDDSGKTWYFVDGIQLTEEAMRKVFVRGYDGHPPLPKREHRIEPKDKVPRS